MNRILIVFAHPRFEQSRNQQALVKALPNNSSITFVDLYELYPDFNIDIQSQQELLLQHDIIIWQHPFYWYSAPPLLKQWIDMVLEFGWAYGPGGIYLKDKVVLNVITAGGTREVYQNGARNRYPVAEFLKPFEQTARLCGMHYLPPFAIHGTHRLDDQELTDEAGKFTQLINYLLTLDTKDKLTFNMDYINDLPALNQK